MMKRPIISSSGALVATHAVDSAAPIKTGMLLSITARFLHQQPKQIMSPEFR